MLIAGRFVIGVGVGVASQIVPLYLSEVAPVQIRGTLVAINNGAVVVGQLTSSCLVLAIVPNWRLMLGLAAVRSTLQFFGMIFLPESPRWLGKQGFEGKQEVVMRKIYKPEHFDEANDILNHEVNMLKEETKMTESQKFKALFSTYKKCVVIGCGIQAFQQLVGINTAMYYGPTMM